MQCQSANLLVLIQTVLVCLSAAGRPPDNVVSTNRVLTALVPNSSLVEVQVDARAQTISDLKLLSSFASKVSKQIREDSAPSFQKHEGMASLLATDMRNNPRRCHKKSDCVIIPGIPNLPRVIPVLFGANHSFGLNTFFWLVMTSSVLVGMIRAWGSIIAEGSANISLSDDNDDFPRERVDAETYATWSARKRRWAFLREPKTGFGAKCYQTCLICLVFLSLATLVLQSFHYIDLAYQGLFDFCEWNFYIVFFGDFISAAWSALDRSAFFSHWMNWLDLLAVIPSALECCSSFNVFGDDADDPMVAGDSVEFFTMLKLCWLARLFRVVRYLQSGENSSRSLKIFFRGLANAGPALALYAMVTALTTIGFSVVMYLLESGEWNQSKNCYVRDPAEGCSPFQNVLVTFYWTLATTTTVGYGDVTPVTNIGKCLAAMTMMAGVLSVGLPVALLTNNFVETVAEIEKEEGSAIGTSSFQK